MRDQEPGTSCRDDTIIPWTRRTWTRAPLATHLPNRQVPTRKLGRSRGQGIPRRNPGCMHLPTSVQVRTARGTCLPPLPKTEREQRVEFVRSMDDIQWAEVPDLPVLLPEVGDFHLFHLPWTSPTEQARSSQPRPGPKPRMREPKPNTASKAPV